MSFIEVKNISKSFDGRKILDNISLSIEKGSFVTFLGSSGCGKTTLLRSMMGLEKVDSGEIYLMGKNITDIPMNQREMVMIFQQYCLFPTMNVYNNVSFSLRMKKIHKDEIAERVSKSRTAVTNSMRLLKLNSKVQQMVIDDMISTGHARALLALEDEEQQYTIANKIFDEKLSVRETEKLIKILKNPKKTAKKEKIEHTFIYENLEEKMKGIMGTKVNVNPKSNGKGKIEIEYYSEEELERIFDLIMSIQS